MQFEYTTDVQIHSIGRTKGIFAPLPRAATLAGCAGCSPRTQLGGAAGADLGYTSPTRPGPGLRMESPTQLPPCRGSQGLADTMFLDEEADAVAGVGLRVLLRLSLTTTLAVTRRNVAMSSNQTSA